MPVQIKRIYEAMNPADGERILVDRLWPRGIKKADAHLAAWSKDLAPSTALRRWFDHVPERFAEFTRRYERELETPAAREALHELAERARHETITLVYAAHDERHNHAVVLQGLLQRGR
jgi:uncharacterized protein YeaO (DUF488 family)